MSIAATQKKPDPRAAVAHLKVALANNSAGLGTPVETPAIQLKSSCACGGGCPNCRDENLNIQPKLNIGQPDDPYELEADSVADQIMRMPEPVEQHPLLKGAEGKKKESIQLKEVSGSTPVVTSAIQTQIRGLQGKGQPLPASVQAFFEPRFGHDFSQVRVHTDVTAAGTAGAINARAFTLGHDVVFGAGQYSPKTDDGQRLLAHELTHVVQQQNNIYRQTAPPHSTTSSTGWSTLPPAAKKVLTRSYNTRHKGEWLWRYYNIAADCFDKNLTPDRQRAFLNVYNALSQQGLWKYVKRVIEVWPTNVQAIKFKSSVPNQKLRASLQSNSRFCRDTWSKKLPKWRQAVTAGSPGLHIIIPGSGSCEAHIDQISPIDGREPSGMCKRKVYPEGMHHYFRDKLGWSPHTSLLLGAGSGLTSTAGGQARGLVGLDLSLAYPFISLLGKKIRAQGMLKGELNNLFANVSAGVGVEANYKMFSGLIYGGGIAGELSPGRLGGKGGKFGAGISTGVGVYLSLKSLALQLGVEYKYMKDLVNKDPELHRLSVVARIKIW